jgi:glycosyltransferase involved in cell wall biosynthesis
LSAVDQTEKNIEIIIGDNSVKSDVTSAIAELSKTDPRIRLIRQKRRLPMAAHWNALVREATGEFFVLRADDDLLEPEFIERMLDLCRVAPAAKVFFSDHKVIDGAGEIDELMGLKFSAENFRTRLKNGLLENAAVAVWRTAVPLCSSMIDVALLKQNPFCEELNTPELELFARLVLQRIQFAYTSERLASYRVHGASETESLGLRHDLLCRALLKVPAPASAENERAEYISRLLVTGTTTAFLNGDGATAAEFMRNPLYPGFQKGRPITALQIVAGKLPRRLAARAFTGVHGFVKKVKGAFKK